VPGTFSSLYVGYRRWLVPAVTRRAVHIVEVSESTKSDIIELAGVAPDKITTIHNGVDEGLSPVTDVALLASVRERFALPDRFILTVGAVERQKRLGPFLSAAAPLLRKGLVDAVVLAGEKGRGVGEVEAVVSQLGISEKVRFLGYVPSEVVPALYTLARCSVYPSWYEGFGLPVIEAMACGTPVITSNASSLPEVAGDAALLVPPGDVEAMQQALERVLTDDRLRVDLAAKGIQRATKFRWRTAAIRHVELYHRFLS
jgi:glycosyltransferase involved in cell wall biosynthesis